MSTCLRDRFLVYLMYETGMRIGQVLGLRHADIRYWEDTVLSFPGQIVKIRQGQIPRSHMES
jgi:integrase